MSRSRAIEAIRLMRKAADDGDIQLASYWSLIFLAEDQSAATGDFLRERRMEFQKGPNGQPEEE